MLNIDFGNTAINLNYIDNDNKILFINDVHGKHSTPANLTFYNDQIYFGYTAKNAQLYNGAVNFNNFKLKLLRNETHFNFKDSYLNMRELLSILFNCIKQFVELNINKIISNVNISLSNNINNNQRILIIEACNLINLTVVNILNNTSMVALTYRNHLNAEYFTIIEISSSNFNISLIQYKNNVINYIDVLNDASCYGINLDKLIYSFIKSKLLEFDNNIVIIEKLKNKIILIIEELKICLSINKVFTIELDNISNNKNFKLDVTIELFNSICEPYFKNIEKNINFFINKNKTDNIILEGGYTRIINIKSIISTYYKNIINNLNVDDNVINGLTEYYLNSKKYIINEKINNDIYLNNTLIIEKNTVYPIEIKKQINNSNLYENKVLLYKFNNVAQINYSIIINNNRILNIFDKNNNIINYNVIIDAKREKSLNKIKMIISKDFEIKDYNNNKNKLEEICYSLLNRNINKINELSITFILTLLDKNQLKNNDILLYINKCTEY